MTQDESYSSLESRIAAYLDEQEIYDLFQELLVDLSLHLPEDPVQFLIKRLHSPPPQRVFLFGSGATSEVAAQLGFPVIALPEVPAGPSADSDLSAALHRKLAELEETSKPAGYVVCGFPANRIQARAMQTTWKFLPTRMVQLGSAPGVAELFPGVCREFSTPDVSAIGNFIRLKSFSLAPTRPRRIAVVQASAALARGLADHYGLVYVPGAEISASLGVEGVKARLLQDDCRRSGWVLDGFPVDAVQVAFLQAINAAPTRLVALGPVSADLKSHARVLELPADLDLAEQLKHTHIYVDHPLN